MTTDYKKGYVIEARGVAANSGGDDEGFDFKDFLAVELVTVF